jgi:hypothetical protein
MPPLDFKIKQPGATLMVALSAAFPFNAMAANAGRIDFAAGDVQALAADGRSRPLTKGATFDSGETIETGGNGRAQLRFTDGAQISLQPQSQFRVDNYQFSGQADGSEKGLFSLLKGGLRTITGLVGRANRDNYKVTTAVATIGIRGTEYSIQYGNSITVTTGEGVIEICNAAGCLILNSGETAYVANSDTQPAMTDKKADVPPPPPENETLYNASRTNEVTTALGGLPTPVSEMNALSGTLVYSKIYASDPTYTLANPGTVSSGSLTADFTAKLVDFTLSLNIVPNTISGTGGHISGASIVYDPVGSAIYINGSGSGSFSGVFTGSNAAQAQISYKITGSPSFGTVSGSATFQKP